MLSRSRAGELGRETATIVDAGRYTVDGDVVEIADLVRAAIDGAVTYLADDDLPQAQPRVSIDTSIAVTAESTLEAARRLIDDETRDRVLALNFASAKNPGGGWLGGSRAQEESLARSSALVATIEPSPMYEFHRANPTPFYSHAAIVSPEVPVFREDDGDLLPKPYRCSFITCAAVNAGVALERDAKAGPQIRDTMRERVDRVLAIARAHEYRTLILGAWGCGVFKNDPPEIATLFADALEGEYRAAFDHVCFAIHARPSDTHTLRAFQTAFPDASA